MISFKNGKTIGFSLFFRKISILFIFTLIGLTSLPTHAFDLYLGTGPEGTFSHFSGRMIARSINSHVADVNCKVAPAEDDTHNLTNLQQGSLDIAVIDSRMLHDAFNKTGYFEFFDIQYDNMMVLFPLYEIPRTLIVRQGAGITTLSEIKGKRINAGAPRSMAHLAVDTIMKAKNWSREDFQLITEISDSQSQDRMAFCHGTVQAMIHIGVHPDLSLRQMFRLCKADLVDMIDNDIEKLINDHPAFFAINIPENTYASHPESVKTFGTKGMLIASGDLDEKMVFMIADAIYSTKKQLQQAHPSLSLLPADKAQQSNIGIKLHPGAVKYFSEQQ